MAALQANGPHRTASDLITLGRDRKTASLWAYRESRLRVKPFIFVASHDTIGLPSLRDT